MPGRAGTMRPVKRARRQTASAPTTTPAPSGTASYLTLLAFALGYAIMAMLWTIPALVGWVYLAASMVSFVSYAWDKQRARSGGQRTPEMSLLLLGLACGWPGAMLAQQLLRHKTVKATFRTRFWLTVALNIASLIYLSSPISILRQL